MMIYAFCLNTLSYLLFVTFMKSCHCCRWMDETARIRSVTVVIWYEMKQSASAFLAAEYCAITISAKLMNFGWSSTIIRCSFEIHWHSAKIYILVTTLIEYQLLHTYNQINQFHNKNKVHNYVPLRVWAGEPVTAAMICKQSAVDKISFIVIF